MGLNAACVLAQVVTWETPSAAAAALLRLAGLS